MLTRTKLARLAGFACAAALMQAGLTGCRAGGAQRDAFAAGADRPPTPRTLQMMARLLNENGRADQAEYVLLKTIEQNPGYLPGYIELADLQIRSQRYAAALETMERAHEIAPNDPVISNNVGVLYLRAERYAEASDMFRNAVAVDPDEARYRGNLALSLGMQGLYRDAYEAYASVLEPAEAYWNIGVISEARHDMTSAEAFFNKAHRIAAGDDEPGFAASDRGATASVPTE